ncbi:hypothetical protein AALK94_16655 [Bacteroides faecichinchillae]|mgnify:CR=1 FL=1|uniref:hypothetical protein n=1 Tax=Bacteroides faecichinchillae TaxID=871325 RepID=UPI0010A638AD|nr:hypothetical protein [Bacteroides faecichinchillae]THG54543.1 hypothetical protein E5981_18465 [Bacteroides faecichinchillae]
MTLFVQFFNIPSSTAMCTAVCPRLSIIAACTSAGVPPLDNGLADKAVYVHEASRHTLRTYFLDKPFDLSPPKRTKQNPVIISFQKRACAFKSARSSSVNSV